MNQLSQKPECSRCEKSTHVKSHGFTDSKKFGKRRRWLCQQCGGSFLSSPEPDDAKMAAIRSLTPKDLKAIAMWVSGFPTSVIENSCVMKYERYRNKVLDVYESGEWDEMEKLVCKAYPEISLTSFASLLEDCHDSANGKSGFRQTLIVSQKWWGKQSEEAWQDALARQDALIEKWNPNPES